MGAIAEAMESQLELEFVPEGLWRIESLRETLSIDMAPQL